MRITRVELLRAKEPVVLSEPWHAAWGMPDGAPVTSFLFECYRLTTDEGIMGYGPETGYDRPASLIGQDPAVVGAFFEREMSGRRSGCAHHGADGIEIAMWDILGKAAGLPIYQLLGAVADRIPVYAATSRLMPPDELADHVLRIVDEGFRAVKLRLHREDSRDDLRAVEAVRRAAGDDLMVLADANQHNASPGYRYWDRQTAQRMARGLDELGLWALEEPLPRTDLEGLAAIAASVDTFIAGGEFSPTLPDLYNDLASGAYDIIQPDVRMGGNYGITGVRRAAELADAMGRLIVPHTASGRSFPLGVPASFHVVAAVPNCPVLEFPYDPPFLTTETCQCVLQEPLWIDADGCVPVPSRPGLGVDLIEEMLEVAWTVE